MAHLSGLPEPFHPSPQEQQKYDKSTMKALRRVTGEIDNADHDEDKRETPPLKPHTLDLDQLPTDLYSRPQRQESPSSTKAQHGLGSKRRSRSSSQRETNSSIQAQHSSQTQDFDPDEAMAYEERKFELGDDPRLVLTDAIMKLMELQMKIGKLHAEAYDELHECLKRVIRLSRRKSSVGRDSTD